jgi:hypothetical protein
MVTNIPEGPPSEDGSGMFLLATIYQSTQHHVPQDHSRIIYHSKNLRSHIVPSFLKQLPNHIRWLQHQWGRHSRFWRMLSGLSHQNILWCHSVVTFSVPWHYHNRMLHIFLNIHTLNRAVVIPTSRMCMATMLVLPMTGKWEVPRQLAQYYLYEVSRWLVN